MLSRLLARRHVISSVRTFSTASVRKSAPILVARHWISRTPSIAGRTFTSSSRTNYEKGELSMSKYHELADESMDRLLESLEEIVETAEGAEDWEVDYSSGVLTLKAGEHGTYVINKQPPNMQIWLSSPTSSSAPLPPFFLQLSGPKRYDYSNDDGGVWFYTRDNKSLKSLLEEEIKAILGSPVDVQA
ncbi:Mitochondrial chaperone Frataxin [Tulasnella sp. 424]|nr:Mitochondrial chaperone Frataxin [Tulasnella sp. 424]